ncbi:MAG: RluA family pseudouridine synthase [Ruminococcus sp.]|nr:RluA family pseudouridine synthase [Ruminococcus sp.]
MRQITINKNDAGQRLDKYLSKRFKTMPKSLMYRYLRTKYIKRNGKKASPEVFLSEGDILTFYIKDEFFEEQKSYDFLKAGKELDIVYEDDNILLIDKKVGVICHQDNRYDADALNLRVLRYLYEKGEYDPDADKSFTPALCNRIDRNTGGIVIAAKNAEALRVMNQKIRDNELQKYYLCAVKGCPKPPHAILTAYHYKDEKTNTVRITDKEREGYKKIITEYTVIRPSADISVCEVLLHTGRTHQIRAHMAHIGHPLLGDEKYGDRKLNARVRMRRQALYSYKLRFDFSTPAGCLESLNGKSFEVKKVAFLDKIGQIAKT